MMAAGGRGGWSVLVTSHTTAAVVKKERAAAREEDEPTTSRPLPGTGARRCLCVGAGASLAAARQPAARCPLLPPRGVVRRD